MKEVKEKKEKVIILSESTWFVSACFCFLTAAAFLAAGIIHKQSTGSLTFFLISLSVMIAVVVVALLLIFFNAFNFVTATKEGIKCNKTFFPWDKVYFSAHLSGKAGVNKYVLCFDGAYDADGKHVAVCKAVGAYMYLPRFVLPPFSPRRRLAKVKKILSFYDKPVFMPEELNDGSKFSQIILDHNAAYPELKVKKQNPK